MGMFITKKLKDRNNKAETNVPIKVTNVPITHKNADPTKINDPVFILLKSLLNFRVD
jgi:hypothetical protein